jgi:hypothetical protein
MVLIQHSHCFRRLLSIPTTLVELDQDTVCDWRWPCTFSEHFLKEPQASGEIIGLDTAVYESIVHELVTRQPSFSDSLEYHEGFVKLACLTVAFEKGGESDEVWRRPLALAFFVNHLLENTLCEVNGSTDDADVYDGIVRNGIVRH